MYRNLFFICICVLIQACGSSNGDAAVSDDQINEATDQAVAEIQETVSNALSGEAIGSADEGTAACEHFESGLIPELFDIDTKSVTYRRSIPVKRAGHVLCMAHWEDPNKAQLEDAYQQSIRDWTMSLGSAEKKTRPEYPRTNSEISVTLVADKFVSPAEAVASLDSMVATMTKGITITVGGKERTRRMKFEAPIEGVGDKAVFTEKGTLHMAYDAKRMSLSVSVAGANDPLIQRQQTIHLAQRIIGDN